MKGKDSMQTGKRNKKKIISILSLLSLFTIFIAFVIFMALGSDKFQIGKNNQSPTMSAQPADTPATETPTPEQTPTETPAETVTEKPAQTPMDTPTETPAQTETPVGTQDPGDPGSMKEVPTETNKPQNLMIRTDYEDFRPNEAGEIPIIMFHNFIEAYTESTEKEFTTTFAEFGQLLETLYNEGYRLISMKEFIDCDISVPAGLKPMVFTFDDGSSGQFSLIEENGVLKVNPKSAAGIMIEFNKKHPDFGLKGIFYVNMDKGDHTFEGKGTLRQRFEILLSLGFELGNHTWGHVNFTEARNNKAESIQESIGKNQEKAEMILPGLRFYSLALPFGSLPNKESLRTYLKEGIYNGMEYRNETIMAVGSSPSVPSVSVRYNGKYVSRIRAQGKVPVDCDLTWWLPRMTSSRMFISDGDPSTIVVPQTKASEINKDKLGNKTLITY